MKKIISWGMMLAAAFTLTNCAKEIDNPVQQPESAGYPFEIVASTVDTKTVNDGMSTKWEANDSINVFHAVSGTKTYVNDGEFTLAESDLAAGRFKGNLSSDLEADKAYDWYAFFPYTSQKQTPADAASGWAYIGHNT